MALTSQSAVMAIQTPNTPIFAPGILNIPKTDMLSLAKKYASATRNIHIDATETTMVKRMSFAALKAFGKQNPTTHITADTALW